MPKQVPGPVNLRIAELIGQNATAPAIVRAVAEEFEGYKISTATVSRLRAALNMSKTAGRPVGIARPQEATSPHRQLVHDLHQQGLSLGEIREQIGISRARIHAILTDGK